jgi:hypothetical protein
VADGDELARARSALEEEHYVDVLSQLETLLAAQPSKGERDEIAALLDRVPVDQLPLIQRHDVRRLKRRVLGEPPKSAAEIIEAREIRKKGATRRAAMAAAAAQAEACDERSGAYSIRDAPPTGRGREDAEAAPPSLQGARWRRLRNHRQAQLGGLLPIAEAGEASPERDACGALRRAAR